MPVPQKLIKAKSTDTSGIKGVAKLEECGAWLSLKTGDEDALLTIYDLCFDTLYAYGYRISKDNAIIEDCIQDIFLELWEKRSKLPEVKFVKAYLLKILKRKLIRSTTISQSIELDDAVATFALIDESQEDLIIAEESNNSKSTRLHNALNKLTRRQREIINLKFFSELSYEEIATFTGLSQQRIYNLVHDAVRQLRTDLFSIPRHVATFLLAMAML